MRDEWNKSIMVPYYESKGNIQGWVNQVLLFENCGRGWLRDWGLFQMYYGFREIDQHYLRVLLELFTFRNIDEKVWTKETWFMYVSF